MTSPASMRSKSSASRRRPWSCVTGVSATSSSARSNASDVARSPATSRPRVFRDVRKAFTVQSLPFG